MSFASDVDASVARARELLTHGNIAGAEPILNKAIAANQNHSGACYLLAAIAESRGELPRATDFLTRAVEASPNDATLRAALGAMLLRQDRLEPGIEHL